MKPSSALIVCMVLAGCAGRPAIREGETVPYKAIVVFQWLGEKPAPSLEVPEPEGAGGPDPAPVGQVTETPVPQAESAPSQVLTQLEVEDAIIEGLEEYQVFSDFLATDWEGMHEVANREDIKGDLIVLVRIGELVEWNEEATRIVPGLAALDTALWLTTGIGGWWIGDREFPTSSDVEVRWKRPDPDDIKPRVLSRPAELNDIQKEFTVKEPLSSAEYKLSFWERARPWRAPLPYLMSILVPPPFVPLSDLKEVDRSLEISALSDLKRELARKLKGGNIRSAGSPFLFSLEQPKNGAIVGEEAARLYFRYRVELDVHKNTGLKGLTVRMKRGDGDRYEVLHEYSEGEIRSVNERIVRDDPIEEEVRGLAPGLNLIRFEAIPELGGKQSKITNTVALLRQ